MNIIVTGASQGIGYELVKYLSSIGSHNILAIARNRAQLEKLKKEINSLNTLSSIHILALDISKDRSIELVYKYVNSSFSSIDILINNAGLLINKPFSKVSKRYVQEIFEINLFSVINLIQKMLPIMGKPQTHIVNIGSMGGFQGSSKFSGLSIYSASKAALANLTECLAEELKPQNVFVNCLALGAVQTEMLKNAFPGYNAPVSASEIAVFIADFSLNGYKYINGKIIPVSLSTPWLDIQKKHPKNFVEIKNPHTFATPLLTIEASS